MLFVNYKNQKWKISTYKCGIINPGVLVNLVSCMVKTKSNYNKSMYLDNLVNIEQRKVITKLD